MKATDMLNREYTVKLNGTITHVNIFIAPPYRETHRLHNYIKRRRVWMMTEMYRTTRCGFRRTRQIERWCRLAGAKRRVTHIPMSSADTDKR